MQTNMVIPRIKHLRSINGRLSKKCWSLVAKKAIGFFTLPPGELATPQTNVYGMFDNRNLYILFECFENEVNRIEGKSIDTSVLNNYSVEVFMDVEHNHEDYYHLIVNLRGDVFCSRIDLKSKIEMENNIWKSNCSVTTRLEDTVWFVEISIPFSDFGINSIKEGDVWGINFVRTRFIDRPLYSTWSPGLKMFRCPEKFGHLIFEKTFFSLDDFSVGNWLVGDEASIGILLTNQRSGSEEVLARTSILSPAGNKKEDVCKVKFHPKETKKIPTSYLISESGRHVFSLEIVSPLKKNKRIYYASYSFNIPPLLGMHLSKIFYYDNEEPEQIQFSINSKQLKLADCKLNIELKKKNENNPVLLGEVGSFTAKDFIFPVRIKKMNSGTYEFVASLRNHKNKFISSNGLYWYKYETGISSFILIPGSEVSVCRNGKDLHELVLGRDKRIRIFCHPDYMIGAKAKELSDLNEYEAIEVYNETGTTYWWKDWDSLLTNGQCLWAIASDDTHEVSGIQGGPGRGWIVVKGEEFSVEGILKAIAKGSFYASTGPIIKDIFSEGGRINILLVQFEKENYKIRFLGKNGKELSVVKDSKAFYNINGDEIYVRIEIVNLQDNRIAWTQPIFIVNKGKIKDPYIRNGCWYKGNLHAHTTNSDGKFSPYEIIEWYQKHDYSFLAITDHNYCTR